MTRIAAVVLLGAAALANGHPGAAEVRIPSSLGGEPHPARWLAPQPGSEPTPLLIWLHSWSADHTQTDPGERVLEGAGDRGWACILPNFRGPNSRPEACASPAARRDILDAAAWAIDRDGIDPDRVYLAGSSGGGHMALVMAGEAPGVWAAVGASVPITDLARWHAFHTRDGETGRYARDLEAVCGGPPSAGRLEALAWDGCERDREYRRRSPLRLLHRAAGLPVRLEAGIRDGHAGSVPVDHTLLAFNALAIANARPEARLTHAQIDAMTASAEVPAGLAGEPLDGQAARRRLPVLLRKTAGPAELVIFDGAHETDLPALFGFLEDKRRAPARPGPGAAAKRVLVLGDSNAASRDGWVDVLRRLRPAWTVANPSLAGATIGFDNNGSERLNTLARLGGVVRAHEPDAPFDHVLIALGTNDAKRVFACREDEAFENMRSLIVALRGPLGARLGGPSIAIAAPPPVLVPDDPNGKYAGAGARVRIFKAAFRDLSERNAALFIDLHAPIEPDARRLLGDGVHLTAEAHWMVARLIDASLSRP